MKTSWILFAIVSVSLTAGRAQDDPGFEPYRKLVKRQPFMPAAGATPATPKVVASGFRFTGFVVIGGKARVGIENAMLNKSYLLGLGQREDGIEVKEINLKEQHVTLVVAGELIQLGLMSTVSPPAVVVQTEPRSVPSTAAAGAAANDPPPPTLVRRIIIPKNR